MKRRRLTILSSRDALGRARYSITWPVERHPYCPSCGGNVNDHVNPSTRCKRCGVETRGRERAQHFFAVPEEHAS